MTLNLKIALIIITIVYLFKIIQSVKKRKLQTSFSIFWIITGVLLIIAILIPNFIDSISHFLGFEKTSNMIFCITIFLSFYLIFNLTMLLSKEYKRNVELIQELSILKKRVGILEEKSNERNNDQSESR